MEKWSKHSAMFSTAHGFSRLFFYVHCCHVDTAACKCQHDGRLLFFMVQYIILPFYILIYAREELQLTNLLKPLLRAAQLDGRAAASLMSLGVSFRAAAPF